MMVLRMPIAALPALALLVLLSSTHARSWSSEDLPSPQHDADGVCGRGGETSVVCDPDGLLSQSDADTIDGLANFIEGGTHGFKKVPCPARGGELVGAQIAVAIFDSMSFGLGDKEKRAFQFAKDLHDRWGVGDAKCQNGVVIVLAIKDRAMGISIGAGLKNIFKDSMLPGVMGVMKPKLREKEYGQAIVTGFTAVGNILSGGKPPQVEEDFSGTFVAIIIGMTAVFGISQCIASGHRNRRYNRCRDVLDKMDKDRAKASNNLYVVTSCPICLEDFPTAAESAEVITEDTGIVRSSGAESVTLNLTNKGTFSSQPTRTVTAGLRPAFASRAAVRGTASNFSEEEEVRTLPCGHKFHDKCILTWFSGAEQTNRQCPICRQPIAESDGQSVESRTNSGRPGGWDVYDPEYSFRMQRAHYYYPDYITWSMMNSWERDRYQHHRPMATSSAFAAVDPVVVAAAARASGGGGSSFSFGGGSSAGGGGGGGSW